MIHPYYCIDQFYWSSELPYFIQLFRIQRVTQVSLMLTFHLLRPALPWYWWWWYNFASLSDEWQLSFTPFVINSHSHLSLNSPRVYIRTVVMVGTTQFQCPLTGSYILTNLLFTVEEFRKGIRFLIIRKNVFWHFFLKPGLHYCNENGIILPLSGITFQWKIVFFSWKTWIFTSRLYSMNIKLLTVYSNMLSRNDFLRNFLIRKNTGNHARSQKFQGGAPI